MATKINEEKNITCSKNNGALVLRITCLIPILGTYTVACLINGSIKQIGNGDLNDNIPDIIILPYIYRR